jgi:hypothetical protein
MTDVFEIRKNCEVNDQRRNCDTKVIQNYLYCEADFPWLGPDDPVEANPPGRELGELIYGALRPRFSPASELWNHEGFGWAFNCKSGRATINVLVTLVNDHWLIMSNLVTLVPRFLRTRSSETALSDVCHALDQFVRSDSRFRNIQWFTAESYERRPILGKRSWSK